MRVIAGSEGGLTILLPEASASGRIDILGPDGRRAASLPAAARVHWSPGRGPASGPFFVVWSRNDRAPEIRLAPPLAAGR